MTFETRGLEKDLNTPLLQPAFQRGRTHRVAVIGMEDQRLSPAFADSLP